MKQKKVVVLGGGTGSFTLLSALKHYSSEITAVVNMADDGGSTGILRDELGVLPPGDVRQCLVALSETPRLRDLFNYRFEEGSLAGHSFGNLFLTALEKMTGDFAEAVEEASQVLNIIGRVEPITLNKMTLVMDTADGRTIQTENEISGADFQQGGRPALRLEPAPVLNPRARSAILAADAVIVAPGNIYSSLAPALMTPGIGDALNETSARKLYVCNLVTKPGQTSGFSVGDFAEEIERFGGFKLDDVLYNDMMPGDHLLQRYAKAGEFWVEPDTVRLENAAYRTHGGAFVSDQFVATNSGKADPIAASRTLIRHDSEKIAIAIMKLLEDA